MVRFDTTLATPDFKSNGGYAVDATYPNGFKLTYSYQSVSYRKQTTGTSFESRSAFRLTSITSSSGYKATFSYVALSPGVNGVDFYKFYSVKAVTQSNAASGSGFSQTMTMSADSSGLSYTLGTPAGTQTVYRLQSGYNVAGITLPGSSSEDVTVGYDGSNRVSTVSTPTGTTTYGYAPDNGNSRTVTVTDPLGRSTTYVFDISLQRMTQMTLPAPISKTTTWAYDSSGRVTRITSPEGNYTNYTYDGRGNTTETRMVAKPGTGLADIVTSAGFDASCSSPAKCNSPNWTKDANNNQTDYSYDGPTGNLLTVQRPAAVQNGPRPTTIYSYSSVNGVSMVTGVSTCATATSCAGTANETKTTIGYNSNGLPTSVTTAAGDNSISATVTATYDDAGNKVLQTDALGNDTRYRYDANRQLVGVIAPDPDGSGPLVRRAQRNTYDARGRVTVSAVGTVSDASDAAWNNFSEAYSQSTTFDAAGRAVRQAVSAGGTTYSVADAIYDANNLQTCSIQYMDPANWGPQASSCAPYQTGGPNGPDRVTQSGYDEAGRLTSVTSGVGTAAVSTELQGYTDNGKVAQVKDGNSNPTVYTYDGFDRKWRTNFADGTFEQLDHDANGNITSRRLRDGTAVGYGYDGLNRVTSKTPPSPDYAVNYGFDLLGRVTSISRPADGVSHGFTYDALSRLSAETQPFGSVAYQYDAANRRTRLTWSDGNYVTYEYLATGEVSAIRENGSGLLASYGYDNLGRRASLTRGNGTVTSYGYDAVSRLTSLSHDLGGTAYDTSTTFSYNPAGQIASQTRSNDAYAWNGALNVDRSYGVNALNQLTSAGSTSLGYDARGNLTTSGSSNYTYSSENLMKTGPGVSMYYDALGRLHEYDTTVSTRFVYDGGHIAAEIANPSGAIQRRYVFGPGSDEPLVWYEGSSLGDRRWLVADERGSVVATTNGSGNVIGVNSYDEYGIPAAGNIGRFQYTGQAWLPELGMSYYKARIYSPSLGRFMQTDPIGYGDGLNWYNYVQSDPVNQSDTSGLCGGVGKTPTERQAPCGNQIVVTGSSGGSGGAIGSGGRGAGSADDANITVNGHRPSMSGVNGALTTGAGNALWMDEPGFGAIITVVGRRTVPSVAWQGNLAPVVDSIGCGLEAAGKNWKGLALDGAGWLAFAAFPEGSAGTAIAGSILGATAIGVSASDLRDHPILGSVTGSIAYLGKQSAVAEGFLRGERSELGHRLGLYSLVASTLVDGALTSIDFNNCVNKKAR